MSSGIKFKPEPYQEEIIDFLMGGDIRYLIAGMGLGKTVCSLTAWKQLRDECASIGLLVIAPKRVSILTWPNEIQKFDHLRDLRYALLRTEEGVEAWHRGSADVYLLNYEMLPKFCNEVLRKVKKKSSMPVDTILWDEISKTKNPKGKRVGAYRKYRRAFDNHWGMTGTPQPNSEADLFNQVRTLDGGETFGGSFVRFQRGHFRQMDYNGYKFDVTGEGKKAITEAMAPFSLVMRSEDHLNVPETFIEEHTFSLPPKAKKAYDELVKELITRVGDDEVIDGVNAAVLIGKFKQVTAGIVYGESDDFQRKVIEIHDKKIEILKGLLKKLPGKNFLVAINFIHERERILREVPEAVEFDGSSEMLGAWNRGEIRALVANPKSMSHGLNMQEGGTEVVWMTITHSSEEHDQTNARLIRMGQDQKTTIHYLLASDTVDEAALETVRQKISNQEATQKTIEYLRRLL